MRTVAEVLFWLGRLETVACVVIVAHSIVIWRWRYDSIKSFLAATWLIVFSIGSLLSLNYGPPLLFRALDGTGYILAHLYGTIWTDQEAFTALVQRWQRVWLPNYLPWLSVWLLGLLSIAPVRTVQRLMIKPS